jgi:septal ring factor EnvC (AmiA/AmiB activator)
MTPEQLKREIGRLHEEIAAVERAISISEGAFKKMFEDHLVRVKDRLQFLQEQHNHEN